MAQGTVHVPELASQVPVKEDKGEIKNNKKKWKQHLSSYKLVYYDLQFSSVR